MDNLYGLNFINMIKSSIQNARDVAGQHEILTRCPFCGDSANPRNAHFYISVPNTPDEVSFYDCKKCPAHGILNDEVLRKLGCQDNNTIIQVQTHNSRVLKLPKYKTLKKINIYPLKNNYIRDDENNKYKLDYINKRIGANFTYEDLIKLKIFLNLYDILNSNRLVLTRDKRIGDSLDLFFIGFISYDNSFCGLRKVTEKELYKSINKRYINYDLVNKNDNSKAYYIVPTQIDILNPAPIRIHIAEGQFDILSIFYNLNKSNIYQNIYIACGGKSYRQALEFILTELGIINFEVHFYPDKDVTEYEFNNTLYSVNMLPCNIFIHKNIQQDEKDYGVPMDRIKDSVRMIKEIDYV